MKWVLVFIVIAQGEAHVDYIDQFERMEDCFYAREDLASYTGGTPGYFLPGMQGICILTEEEELR